MKHKANRLDVVTDLKRVITSSYSKRGFSDPNVKIFLENAEKNLKVIDLDRKNYSIIIERIKKAKNRNQPIEKRREDILIAASFI